VDLLSGTQFKQFNQLLLNVGQLGQILIDSATPNDKRQSAQHQGSVERFLISARKKGTGGRSRYPSYWSNEKSID